MKVICAWCGRIITDGPDDSDVSHGICTPCEKRYLEGLEKPSNLTPTAYALV